MSRIFNSIKNTPVLDLLSVYSMYALGLFFIAAVGIAFLGAIVVAVGMLFTADWFAGVVILSVLALLTWAAIRLRQ